MCLSFAGRFGGVFFGSRYTSQYHFVVLAVIQFQPTPLNTTCSYLVAQTLLLCTGRDLTSSAAAPEQSYDNSTLRLGPAFLQGPAPSFAPIPLAFAPDASVQATDTPLGLQSALSANSSRVATQAANIINYTQCNSSCGTGCSDFTENNAAALNYLNYLQYPATTGSCSDCGGFFQAAADLVGVSTCTQYSCCVQVCSVDTDCPADYYCQSGYPIGAACKKCDACDVTTNSKCQTDQSCTYTYDCCLDSVTEFCYVPWNVGAPTQLDLNSGEYCCPSSPSSYNSFENGVCSCGSQQSCGYPPPPPPNSPPPPSAPPPPPRAPLLPVRQFLLCIHASCHCKLGLLVAEHAFRCQQLVISLPSHHVPWQITVLRT